MSLDITWVSVSLIDGGGEYRVLDEYWNELRSAYQNWYERRADRVLEMTSIDGASFLVAASRISDLFRCSPVDRAKKKEIEELEEQDDGGWKP